MNIQYAQILKAVYEVANKGRRDRSTYFTTVCGKDSVKVWYNYPLELWFISVMSETSESSFFGYISGSETTDKLVEMGADPSTIKFEVETI